MNWPRDNDAELDAFYGRPDGSARWEVTNLTYINTPWRAYLAGTPIVLSRGIRVHKKVADSLTRIFQSLWETFGKSQAEIEKVDLHQIGGAYYFRARRGSKRLSNHARGIAIDIDPQDNPMGREGRGDMDPRVVAAFKAEGWRWGGDYAGSKDKMHYEAVFSGQTAKPAPTIPTDLKTNPALLDKLATAAWVTKAVPLIKHWEQFKASPYYDFGQWSNGYGQKCDKDAAPITEAQASKNLADYLAGLLTKVVPLIKVKLTANQGAALLVFSYNVGDAALAKSTLLKRLNAGDIAGAAAQFAVWNKATVDGKKKVLPGLVKRRAAEKELFLTP